MADPQFLSEIKKGRIFVSDGATGTNLQARGLAQGTPAERWVLENPEAILKLHQDFILAGSDIILTCTFGATPIRLESAGLADRVDEVNKRAIELARIASAESNVLVAGSIGPTGHLMMPLGPLEEKDAFSAFKAQALALAEVDLFVVETMFGFDEALTAVRAVREVSDLPIVCSFSYDRGTRTMMGITPKQMGSRMTESGLVDVVGINCGKSLNDNLDALKELRGATSLPIWFKPNAGLPQTDASGNTVFDHSPEMMASGVVDWLNSGAKIVGGCCGTSPAHIEKINRAVKKDID